MTEKLVTMDAPCKTFELAPDEVLALYRILDAIVESEMIYNGITLELKGSTFSIKVDGVHEG